MSKLLKLKDWPDRSETAGLLSYLIQEPVKAVDISEIERSQLLTPYVDAGVFMMGFYIEEGCGTFPTSTEIERLAGELEHGASVSLVATIPIPAKCLVEIKTSEGTKSGAVVKIANSNKLCIVFPCTEKTPLAIFAGLEPAVAAHIGSISDDDTYFCKRAYNRIEIFALAKALNEPGVPTISASSFGTGVPEVSPYYEDGMAILANGAGWIIQKCISQPLKIDPPSYRLVIHALLKLLTEPGRAGRNQAGIKEEILARYSGVRGLSCRSLDTIFADANKAAKEIE